MNSRARRRRKRRIIKTLILTTILIIVAAILLGIIIAKKYSLSDEQADLYSYYNISEGETAVILNNEISDCKGYVNDNEVFVPIDFVQQNISSRFYYDSQGSQLMYVLPMDIMYASLDSKAYTLGSDKVKENYTIITKFNDSIYINVDFVKEFAPMDYKYSENPSRIQLTTSTSIKTATIRNDTQVRWRGGVKSPILTEIQDGTTVEIVEKDSPWTKVRTSDGFIGYVQNKHLKKYKTTKVSYDANLPEYTSIKSDEAISLVWHQMINETGNSMLTDSIKNMKNVNTIAPTWFFINDTNGSITSLADAEYVATCHTNGLDVWGVVNDFDGATINGGICSADETYALMSNTAARQHLVQMLISEAVRVGLDGINVDIEKVNDECGVHFSEFVRELSMECRNNKIILSIDNYPPLYTPQYERSEEGKVCDYVVIMAYDEHGTWSDDYGSVASIEYVREAVKDTINENVPTDKIILGIPFYTRLWSIDSSGNFTSETMSMDTATAAIEAAGASISWDSNAKQNYAKWNGSDNITKEIWLEDSKSIKYKMKVYKKYDLAGVAFWKLGMQNDSVWSVIGDKL